MPNSGKTENVQDKAPEARSLDTFDRTILGELAVDAGLSYAELGSRVGFRRSKSAMPRPYSRYLLTIIERRWLPLPG